MNRKELTQRHWGYYLTLENRFMETLSYAALCSDNYKCYSDAYALMLQVIGAEVDAVFKVYCGFNSSDRKSIANYITEVDHKEMQTGFHGFHIRDQKIELREYEITVQPFKDWDAAKPAESLSWWKAFTDIKHDRFGNKEQANQENVLNALAALYLLEMLILKEVTDDTGEIDVFDKGSALFTLRNWTHKVVPMSGAFAILGKAFKEGDKAFDDYVADAS